MRCVNSLKVCVRADWIVALRRTSPDKPPSMDSPVKSPEQAAAEEREALKTAQDALIFVLPAHPAPVVICSQEAPARQLPAASPRQAPPLQPLWRLPVNCFTGQEALGSFLPTWAAQAAQGMGYTKPADSKTAFLLRPSEVCSCSPEPHDLPFL